MTPLIVLGGSLWCEHIYRTLRHAAFSYIYISLRNHDCSKRREHGFDVTNSGSNAMIALLGWYQEWFPRVPQDPEWIFQYIWSALLPGLAFLRNLRLSYGGREIPFTDFNAFPMTEFWTEQFVKVLRAGMPIPNSLLLQQSNDPFREIEDLIVTFATCSLGSTAVQSFCCVHRLG